MQIPKWVWCCMGGLVGVAPMMGATLLNSEQLQCMEQNSSSETVQAVSPECDRPISPQSLEH